MFFKDLIKFVSRIQITKKKIRITKNGTGSAPNFTDIITNHHSQPQGRQSLPCIIVRIRSDFPEAEVLVKSEPVLCNTWI